MGRTKEQQREYMRVYRARKRSDQVVDEVGFQGHKWAATRIAELEEELRHLKEELAKRPADLDAAYLEVMARHPYTCDHCSAEFHTEAEYKAHLGGVERYDDGPQFNTRAFTPVPKKVR